MSFLGWIRRVRVDLFSSADHWADVMAEADTLQADHDGHALEVAEQEERAASGEETRSLFRDVGSVLEGRGEGHPSEVKAPESGPRSHHPA